METKAGIFFEVPGHVADKLTHIANKKGYNSRNGYIRTLILTHLEEYEKINGEV